MCPTRDKSRHSLLCLVMLLFLFFTSWAVIPGAAFSAGLKDIYALAQQNDPLFQSAAFSKMAVEERRKQAIAKFLPTISGTADYTKTYQDIKSTNNTVVAEGDIDYGTTAFGLNLEQPVFHWDSFVGLNKSDAEILEAQTTYILAEHDLIIRVAENYFEALGARDQRDFVVAEKAAVDKHFELAGNRFDMGLIPVTDLHDAKARKAAVMAKSIEAQNILDDAMQALEEITGQPLAHVKQLRDTIDLASPDPQDLNSWIDSAVKHNPAIEKQRHAVEVANLEVDRLHAGHYPTVDLIGSFESTNSDGSIYGGGTEGETADIMVVLQVPLYKGGAVNSRVREARHILSSARQELVRKERAVVRQARAAFLGVKSALRQIEALKQSVVSNQLALEAKQQGFMSGLYASLNVLDAERDLSLANIDYARARYDYLLNNLKLKQAVGTLQEQDLVLIEKWLQ